MEERIADCPLGAKCEEVKTVDGRQIMYRCPWFKRLKGKNPQPPGEPIDHWDCAMGWIPVLLCENTKEALGVCESVDKLRSEMMRGQMNVLRMVAKGEVVKELGHENNIDQ